MLSWGVSWYEVSVDVFVMFGWLVGLVTEGVSVSVGLVGGTGG